MTFKEDLGFRGRLSLVDSPPVGELTSEIEILGAVLDARLDQHGCPASASHSHVVGGTSRGVRMTGFIRARIWLAIAIV